MGFITSAFLLTTAVIVFLPLIVKHMSSNCLDDLDIGDMSGKVVIITGANAGLGYYTTLELAKNNAVIIMGCRSTKRCETAKANILKEAPQAKLETMDLDVASFKSVRNFVNKFLEVHKAVDVLVNNAGIMAVAKHTLTEDGLESQLATNHFGHFLLTGLLFPHISKNGRVVNHSSMGHALATKNFPFSHLQTTEEEYMPWRIYGNTKLANLYFTFELNKRLQRSGNPRNIMSVAVHPGYSATNLQVGKYPFWKQLNGMVGMHAGDGAMSQVYGTELLLNNYDSL